MALRITNLAGSVVAFLRELGTSTPAGGGEGLLSTHLEDANGLPLAYKQNELLPPRTDIFGIPTAGINDGNMLLKRVDRTGAQSVATHQPFLSWFLEGTTINTRLFTQLQTTMTQAQTVQGLTLNNSALTTINTNSQLNTNMLIPMHMKSPLLMRARFRVTQIGLANANAEFGIASQTTTLGATANLNGAYWRFDSSGVKPVFANNGTIVEEGTNISPVIFNNNYYHWGIIKDDDSYTFLCQESTSGTVISRQIIQVPSSVPRSILASHAQPYLRVFNSAVAPSSAIQLIATEWTATLLDINMNMSHSNLMTSLCLGGEINPLTYASTSILANSTVPPTQTLSNTATGQAALDGGVRFAAPVGAATDYTLFSYTVPAGYRHRTKGIKLAAKNLGAAVATTPTQIDFFLVINGNGVTLVGNTLRKYIGTQTFPVGAVIGSAAIEGQLNLDLSQADAITESGRVVGIACRVTTGTATASQVIEVYVTNIGHHE